MEIKPKPKMKKIFDKNDPHFSGSVLILAILTALLQLTFGFGHGNPMMIVTLGMALITLFYVFTSLFYPQNPRWFWALSLSFGLLSIGFVFLFSGGLLANFTR